MGGAPWRLIGAQRCADSPAILEGGRDGGGADHEHRAVPGVHGRHGDAADGEATHADPTMGGVSAGFAFMGDVVIAEPKALIGFAGPRVIEQTVRETLPEGFQRSEFLLEHGAIDLIIDRRDQRERIANLLRLFLKVPPAAA